MKRKLPLAITTVLALPALAAVLPFSENFESGLGEFTVEDSNNDGVLVKTAGYSGVSYSNCIQYPGSADNSADDWLFTPAFSLKKGYTYTLTYQYKVSASNTHHKVEWKAGKQASSSEMSIEIDSEKDFTYNWNSWEKETVTFTVPEDGEYYLGMHIFSDAGQGTIYFDNIEVSDGVNSLAPMSPTVAGAKFSIEDDALNTSFSIILPTQTNGCQDLEADAEIEVIVGREDQENIGSVKGMPGEVVTFIDRDAPQQWTTYHFHCLLAGAESPKVDIDAVPRFGSPKMVENFKVEQDGNEFSLSWDAVTEAANAEELLIPSQVRYLVKCNGETVAENTTELSATYTYPLPEEGQEPVSFTIIANAAGRQSGVVTSENLMVGNPYSGEFQESFANRAFSNKTWVIENNKGWNVSVGSGYSPVVNPQDGDGGCLEFAFSGTQRIWSPVLDLSGLINPKVKFYAYLQPSSFYETLVQPAFLVNGEEIALGETINLASGTEEGWTEFLLDVPEEALAHDCQLMFSGTGTNSYSGKFFIDNISILSYLEHNLAVNASKPAKSLEIGQKVVFPITIENKGVNIEKDYIVSLLADGEKVAEMEGPAVEPQEKASAKLSFAVLPKYAGKEVEFTAIVALTNDGDLSDNETSLTIPVNENDLERVPSLNASLSEDSSSVKLEWTAPKVSDQPVYTEMTESFEDWETGSIEGANGWIFVDADGIAQKGFNNMNQGAMFAAMVAENYTPSNSWEAAFNSHEGSKCLAMTDPYSYGSEVDNIIISPEVKGGTDVTFYTMVFSSYGNPEVFTILWSEGGIEPDDFIELETMVSPRNEWAEKEFTLPDNARRFAVRITGKPVYPVMFDSFTFTAYSSPAVHTGFNVYRDHELLAAYPAETLSHVDTTPVRGAEHTYQVTALFDKGESHYSEAAKVKIKDTETGVEEIISDGTDVEFFTLQGLRISNPAKGEIVIVRKGGKTFKAIVK